MTHELNNIIWSVSKDEDDDYTPSYDVKDVFWLQEQEMNSIKAEDIRDGEYHFYCYYGRTGTLIIENGKVVPETIDQWFEEYHNDHVFVEGMTMNPYGLIEIHFGS